MDKIGERVPQVERTMRVARDIAKRPTSARRRITMSDKSSDDQKPWKLTPRWKIWLMECCERHALVLLCLAIAAAAFWRLYEFLVNN